MQCFILDEFSQWKDLRVCLDHGQREDVLDNTSKLAVLSLSIPNSARSLLPETHFRMREIVARIPWYVRFLWENT